MQPYFDLLQVILKKLTNLKLFSKFEKLPKADNTEDFSAKKQKKKMKEYQKEKKRQKECDQMFLWELTFLLNSNINIFPPPL